MLVHMEPVFSLRFVQCVHREIRHNLRLPGIAVRVIPRLIRFQVHARALQNQLLQLLRFVARHIDS